MADLVVLDLPFPHLAPFGERGQPGGILALALELRVVLVEGFPLVGDVRGEARLDDHHQSPHHDLERPVGLLDQGHELAPTPAIGHRGDQELGDRREGRRLVLVRELRGLERVCRARRAACRRSASPSAGELPEGVHVPLDEPLAQKERLLLRLALGDLTVEDGPLRLRLVPHHPRRRVDVGADELVYWAASDDVLAKSRIAPRLAQPLATSARQTTAMKRKPWPARWRLMQPPPAL